MAKAKAQREASPQSENEDGDDTGVYTYRVIQGRHAPPDGMMVGPGDLFESDDPDLVKKFPNKFELAHQGPREPRGQQAQRAWEDVQDTPTGGVKTYAADYEPDPQESRGKVVARGKVQTADPEEPPSAKRMKEKSEELLEQRKRGWKEQQERQAQRGRIRKARNKGEGSSSLGTDASSDFELADEYGYKVWKRRGGNYYVTSADDTETALNEKALKADDVDEFIGKHYDGEE